MVDLLVNVVFVLYLFYFSIITANDLIQIAESGQVVPLSLVPEKRRKEDLDVSSLAAQGIIFPDMSFATTNDISDQEGEKGKYLVEQLFIWCWGVLCQIIMGPKIHLYFRCEVYG